MPLEWWQHDGAPSRFEAEAEAARDMWLASYEERIREWCAIRELDPESLDATLAYEAYIAEMKEQT